MNVNKSIHGVTIDTLFYIKDDVIIILYYIQYTLHNGRDISSKETFSIL